MKKIKRSLRVMKHEDVPVVAAIDASVQFEPWSEKTYHDCLKVGFRGWVICVGKTIEAFAMAHIKEDACHVLNLCVRPESQRQGLASQLLEQCKQYGHYMKVKKMNLEVRPSNDGARKLYGKWGFKQIDLFKDYYAAPDGREDGLVLELDI